jgi:hypothetical protein
MAEVQARKDTDARFGANQICSEKVTTTTGRLGRRRKERGAAAAEACKS